MVLESFADVQVAPSFSEGNPKHLCIRKPSWRLNILFAVFRNPGRVAPPPERALRIWRKLRGWASFSDERPCAGAPFQADPRPLAVLSPSHSRNRPPDRFV